MEDPHHTLDQWLAGTPFGEETRESYRHEVGMWLTHIGPRVWHATPRDIDAWAGPPGRTRAHRVSAVRSFYEHTHTTHGYPTTNPALRSLRGSVAGLPTRPTLTRAQTAALVQAADRHTGPHAPRDRALVYLLLSGLRPGPISQLLIQHLHPHDQNGPSYDAPQKGGGTRLEPFPPMVWLAVRDYLPHRVHNPPHSYPDTGPLLTSRTGRPLDPYRTPLTVVRTIAARHELLADIAETINPDGIAHSLPPW